MPITLEQILIVVIVSVVPFIITILLYRLVKKLKKERLIRKAKTIKKRIKNINKHLKIADASKNLHEVRMHAREAMRLIKKYDLVEDYRKIFRNK